MNIRVNRERNTNEKSPRAKKMYPVDLTPLEIAFPSFDFLTNPK